MFESADILPSDTQIADELPQAASVSNGDKPLRPVRPLRNKAPKLSTTKPNDAAKEPSLAMKSAKPSAMAEEPQGTADAMAPKEAEGKGTGKINKAPNRKAKANKEIINTKKTAKIAQNSGDPEHTSTNPAPVQFGQF